MKFIETLRNALKGKTPFQKRVKGRIWSYRVSQQPPSEEAIVVFAIPLVGKKRTKN